MRRRNRALRRIRSARLEKVVGDVTVVRNGVAVALHIGDAVFKSDVIVTGADSSAGITFPDGTVLDLVANTRMALNEYSFEPNGTANGAVFTLVEGTFGFVAGQVAHGNHMSVVTPVATMGIHGTAGIVKHEFRANAGNLLYSFLVLDEIEIRHHGHHVGSYELRDNRPDSPTFGEILRFVMDSGYVTYIEPQGAGLPPIVTTQPITDSRTFEDRSILQDLVDSYAQFNANPGGTHSPGSGDNPFLIIPPPGVPNNGGQPFNLNFPVPGPNGPTLVPINVIPNTTPPPHAPPPNNTNTTPPPPGPTSNVFIWNGGPGTYPTNNWSQPGVPNAPADIVEILSGTVTFPANANVTIAELIIGPNGTLDMVGGSLKVLNGVIDQGTIIVNGDPPTLTITGPLMVASGATFGVQDGTVNLVDVALVNNGTIAAGANGVINVIDLQNGVNFGLVEAIDGGQIIIFNNNNGSASSGAHTSSDNGKGGNQGTIEAVGEGSLVSITNIHGSLDNFGQLLALDGGQFFLVGGLTNHDDNGVAADVVAAGRGSLVSLSPASSTISASSALSTTALYGSRTSGSPTSPRGRSLPTAARSLSTISDAAASMMARSSPSTAARSP